MINEIDDQVEHLKAAVANPNVNVFDIVDLGNGRYSVVTYQKPFETNEDFLIRHDKNLRKAEQIKHPKLSSK